MKLAHLSHHEGCKKDVDYVCARLGVDCEFMQFRGGYNIGPARADEAWCRWADKLNSVDVVLTSDTAPLARIVFRHLREFKGRLVIWVCNRFDYHDGATNDCGFPDPGYYDEFRAAVSSPQVQVVSYTAFEHVYARKHRGVEIGRKVIKPIGKITVPWSGVSAIPPSVEKGGSFFIPPYHNDTHWRDMQELCGRLGVRAYRGRYNGMEDVGGFRGVIHIPYAWSNFAWFEAAQLGIPYLVPSKRMILELSMMGRFFWSPPFDRSEIGVSEWYCGNHSGLMAYFDSWDELVSLCGEAAVIEEKRAALRRWSEGHTEDMISRWREILHGCA